MKRARPAIWCFGTPIKRNLRFERSQRINGGSGWQIHSDAIDSAIENQTYLGKWERRIEDEYDFGEHGPAPSDLNRTSVFGTGRAHRTLFGNLRRLLRRGGAAWR